MTVDTLSISRRLQAVGASKELAEEQAQIMRDVVEDAEVSAVTKADLKEMELRLVVQLRSERNRMGFTVIGALAVIVALFEFLAR